MNLLVLDEFSFIPLALSVAFPKSSSFLMLLQMCGRIDSLLSFDGALVVLFSVRNFYQLFQSYVFDAMQFFTHLPGGIQRKNFIEGAFSQILLRIIVGIPKNALTFLALLITDSSFILQTAAALVLFWNIWDDWQRHNVVWRSQLQDFKKRKQRNKESETRNKSPFQLKDITIDVYDSTADVMTEDDVKKAVEMFEKHGIVIFNGFRWKPGALEKLASTCNKNFEDKKLFSGGIRGSCNQYRRRMQGTLTSADMKVSGLDRVTSHLYPFLAHVVGITAYLTSFSHITSSFGSTMQCWHSDVLFYAEEESIASFVALQDVSEDMGPFEFIPGSHVRCNEAASCISLVQTTLDNMRFLLSQWMNQTAMSKMAHVTGWEILTLWFERGGNSMIDLIIDLPETLGILFYHVFICLRPLTPEGKKTKLLCKKGTYFIYSTKLFHRGSRNTSNNRRHMVELVWASDRCWTKPFQDVSQANVFIVDDSLVGTTVASLQEQASLKKHI